jgi:uncharacterized protein YbaR (Trm112 family)
METIDERLLQLLACPACLAAVHQEGEWIVCEGCGRRYPIRDGLPIMLVEEAVEAESKEGSGAEAR